MSFDSERFRNHFKLNEYPRLFCSECRFGHLVWKKDSFVFTETKSSVSERNEEDWNEEQIEESFIGQAGCTNPECGALTHVVGRTSYWIFENEKNEPETEQYLNPEFFYPAVNLFEYPDDADWLYAEVLERIFKLYWVDSSACANAIGQFVEELLTSEGVKRFRINKNRKREKIKLHQRLDIWKEVRPEYSDKLLALKFLRNQGSHNSEVEIEDVNIALEIISNVLHHMYSGHEGRTSDGVRHLSARYSKAR